MHTPTCTPTYSTPHIHTLSHTLPPTHILTHSTPHTLTTHSDTHTHTQLRVSVQGQTFLTSIPLSPPVSQCLWTPSTSIPLKSPHLLAIILFCFLLRPCTSEARSVLFTGVAHCQQGLLAGCREAAHSGLYSDKSPPGAPGRATAWQLVERRAESQLRAWTTQFLRRPAYTPDGTFQCI